MSDSLWQVNAEISLEILRKEIEDMRKTPTDVIRLARVLETTTDILGVVLDRLRYAESEARLP